jgi:hypothetical protein
MTAFSLTPLWNRPNRPNPALGAAKGHFQSVQKDPSTDASKTPIFRVNTSVRTLRTL